MSVFKGSIWNVRPQAPDAEVIEQAASVVRKGGVVVYPTETFYGLGAHPFLEKAIERVYRIKGRDFEKPLPLIASDMTAVRLAVSQWPESAERLARAFWPGPLTLVLSASPHLPPALHARTGKIAVRISSHAVARSLADAAGGLLISTSANRSGDPPCRNPDELPSSLLGLTDGLLHGGNTPGALPSTIVDIGHMPREPARLVRLGCVSWEDIERTIGI